MHIQTHLLSGWCFGNLVPLTARQRLFCMLAATLPDIDGMGFFISREAYWDYHHKLGHCALFGVVMSLILAAFSGRRVLPFVIYLALFHLHLLMDLFGSGPGWTISYLWPFSPAAFKTHLVWDFYSWQNIAAFIIVLGWTVLIAVKFRRTPLELLMPSLDQRFARRITARV